MKFFFPDSQDLVDPSFDFETETRAEFRIRQRDDQYAHEVFVEPPFDGVLVSKAIVEGAGASSGKYSLAQRHRLYRVGIRDFFRLDDYPGTRRLETLGDCGAFSYVREEYPPYSVDDVIQFYSVCGFDYGISVDHAILDFLPCAEQQLELGGALVDTGVAEALVEARRRQKITLDLAADFWDVHRAQRCDFVPIGVAQGWSPAAYADGVDALQRIGYKTIALGGMVPLRTSDILNCLAAVDAVRQPSTKLHLLGVTRCEHVLDFQRYGVESFDSTMPLMQAFKDAKDNYHTLTRTYVAVRVPQVQGNPKLQRRIAAGLVNQELARGLEQRSLRALTAYDRGSASVDEVLEAVLAYENLHDEKADRSDAYRKVLEDRPWLECGCEICRDLGVHVVIFRGAERNRRRGFHNLTVLHAKLRRQLQEPKTPSHGPFLVS